MGSSAESLAVGWADMAIATIDSVIFQSLTQIEVTTHLGFKPQAIRHLRKRFSPF